MAWAAPYLWYKYWDKGNPCQVPTFPLQMSIHLAGSGVAIDASAPYFRAPDSGGFQTQQMKNPKATMWILWEFLLASDLIGPQHRSTAYFNTQSDQGNSSLDCAPQNFCFRLVTHTVLNLSLLFLLLLFALGALDVGFAPIGCVWNNIFGAHALFRRGSTTTRDHLHDDCLSCSLSWAINHWGPCLDSCQDSACIWLLLSALPWPKSTLNTWALKESGSATNQVLAANCDIYEHVLAWFAEVQLTLACLSQSYWSLILEHPLFGPLKIDSPLTRGEEWTPHQTQLNFQRCVARTTLQLVCGARMQDLKVLQVIKLCAKATICSEIGQHQPWSLHVIQHALHILLGHLRGRVSRQHHSYHHFPSTNIKALTDYLLCFLLQASCNWKIRRATPTP